MILSPITFPGLGISVDPPRIAFYLGQKPIYLYGIIIAIGFLLAVLYALRRCKAFGLRQDDLLDGVLWVTPFAIVCTRAYYCIFYWDLYRDNPISCLYIWDGGLAIYGGIIGAAIGILVFSRVRKLPVGTILDITSLGFLIGQAMGRWGNFFNREAHGYETDSFLRMGLTDAVGHVAYYHPTFLYESIWDILGFLLLAYISKKNKYKIFGRQPWVFRGSYDLCFPSGNLYEGERQLDRRPGNQNRLLGHGSLFFRRYAVHCTD